MNKIKKSGQPKDWRLIPVPDWALDLRAGQYWPEDEWIAKLDGEEEEDCCRLSVDQILESLTDRERSIVKSITIDGDTFESVACKIGLSKQRVHQIYKGSLVKLKERLGGLKWLGLID